MGRLKALPPRIAAMPSRISTHTDAEGHSTVGEARRWYGTPEWQALRKRVFERDDYTCQWPGCGTICLPGDRVRPPVADHVEPHRGDRSLFFDDDNVQTLCKPCHDSKKQALERRNGGRDV